MRCICLFCVVSCLIHLQQNKNKTPGKPRRQAGACKHRCTNKESRISAPNCVCRRLISECLAPGRNNASKMPFPFQMYWATFLFKAPTLLWTVLTKASLNRRLPDKLRAVTYMFSMSAAPMARPSFVVMLMLSKRKSAFRSEISTTLRGRMESSSHALCSLATRQVSAFRMGWAHLMKASPYKTPYRR